MEELRLQAVAARVVAWHNQHPLARRITAAQVQGVGYVALPYGQPLVAGQAWWQAWLAKCRAALPGLGPSLAPAFTEDFIAPIALRRVARWAARHGRVLVQAPGDAPVRDVPLASEVQGQASTVYVLSAAVDLGTLRTRVLVGAHKGFGTSAAVLGPRLWSGARWSASAAAVFVLGLGLAALGWRQTLTAGFAGAPKLPMLQAQVITEKAADAGTELGQAASAPALTQSSAWAASMAASDAASNGKPVSAAVSTHTITASTTKPAAPPVASGAAPGGPAAPALPAKPPVPDAAPTPLAPPTSPSLPAPAAPVLASVPAPAQPQLGRVELPTWGGLISEEAKATARAQKRRQGNDQALAAASTAAPTASAPAAATAAAGGPTNVALRTVAQTATSAPAPVPATARAAGRPAVFALTTRPLRTRAEAEQVMAAMGALLRTAAAIHKLDAGAKTQTDIVPEGEDWRVVGMPYAKRDDAEQARKLLVARGIRVDVVDF
jgi:hypothetical protein